MKRFLFSLMLLTVTSNVVAQLADVNYSVRINRFVHSVDGCGECGELGEEEYTGFGYFRDNLNSSLVKSNCQTCTNNGNCTYAQNVLIGSRTNAAYDLTIVTEGWENDTDPRCEYNTGFWINDDDCRTNVNNTFQFRELGYPSNGYNITNLSVGDCNLSGYYDVTWRYTGTSSLTPNCMQQKISVTAGKIASVAFQLTAGRTYQFGTCGASEDTYLRIYGSNGYTIVALNDNNGPLCTGNAASLNFTPTATGTYYVEIARADRVRLQSNFYLTHQDITPMPDLTASLNGGGNYCFGNSVTLVVNTNAPAGSTYSWYNGSCGGTLLNTTTTNSYTFVASTPGSTNYYVRVNPLGFCVNEICASATVTLPTLGTNLSNDNESSSCIVNGNDFVQFRHASGRLIAAVNSNNQNLGNVTATSFVQTPAINIDACNSVSYTTAALGRRWVITPTTQPTNPVKVRLYFSNVEFQALQSTANTNSNSDDDVTALTDLFLTKYRNDGSPTVNNIFIDNCNSGVVSIWNPGLSGDISALQPGFDVNGRYIEYTISDFSEFWLHGSQIVSPLPVNLNEFSATCEPTVQKLKWTTSNEMNCSHYEIDRSRDGLTWTAIGMVQGNGTSQSTITYDFIDSIKNSSTVYYRLTQVDFDGEKTVLDIISSTCKDNTSFSVYPNPSKGDFTIHYVSFEESNAANILVKDIAGRTILNQAITIKKGQNKFYLNGQGYQSGTYLVYLTGLTNEPLPVKLQMED